jgi:2-keto-4-pentenoate hydratase
VCLGPEGGIGGWELGRNGDIHNFQAEPTDAVDGAGILAFRGMKSLQPVRQLIRAVMVAVGLCVSQVENRGGIGSFASMCRPGCAGSETMVDAVQELARRMLADYDASTPGQFLGEPLDLTTVQAYALQAEIARLRMERGERVIGYKVGCTSRPIQVQLGVKEPIFGRLWGTECHPSGVHLSSARYANLAVEGELAVRLSKDLPREPLSAEECREAIAEVFPVIELHHYVLPEAWPPGQWLIASNGLHAGFVLNRPLTRLGSPKLAHSLSIRINEVVVGFVEDQESGVRGQESGKADSSLTPDS